MGACCSCRGNRSNSDVKNNSGGDEDVQPSNTSTMKNFIVYPPTNGGGVQTPLPSHQEHPISPTVPTQGDSSGYAVEDIIIALYDFDARSDQELSFKANDRMVVICISEDMEWIKARHETHGAEGFIPSNYISKFESLNVYNWFFGSMTRREAELLLTRMQEGTFLVRNSSTTVGGYALSLKHSSTDRKQSVRHYILQFVSEYNKYTIWGKHYHDSLNDLLSHHKENCSGLPILLSAACPKIKPLGPLNSEITLDQFEIDRSEVMVSDSMIGSGYFGEVYRGLFKNETEIAIKVLKEGTMTREEFLEEAKIMKGLIHENIIGLLATCSAEEPIYIITHFMQNGSLIELLKDYKAQETLDLDQMLEFSFQIAKGMSYLEQRPLVHRDLAARNVLVDDRFICKIADFGLARLLGPKGYSITGGKFPIKWSPPEVLQHSTFSPKSDVYSFGMVMIEIFTYGDPLYPGMGQKEIKEKVVKDGLRPAQPHTCPVYIYELLLKCWDANPDSRPTFRDLVTQLDDTAQNNKGNNELRYLSDVQYKQLVAQQGNN